jgi:hypothetical protein
LVVTVPDLLLPKAPEDRQLFSRDFCNLLRGRLESVIPPHALTVRGSGVGKAMLALRRSNAALPWKPIHQ